MNNFTKDELEYLYRAAETEVKYFDDGHIGHSALLKIQSMIDNYCEHEWNTEELMKKIVLNPGQAFPVECKKCGRLYRC